MSPVALVSNDPEVAEMILQLGAYRLIGLFDIDLKAKCLDLPVLGPDAAWTAIKAAQPDLKLAMAVDPAGLKAKLAAAYGLENFATFIAADAHVSGRATVGSGSIIQGGVRIMPGATLGLCCKVNISAAVHHDARVGDFCTLAPGSRLLGNVEVGDRVYIGAGAVILPHCKIGSGATIGAGAVVTKDVPPLATFVGVPARALR